MRNHSVMISPQHPAQPAISETARRAIEAYGGADRWRKAQVVEVKGTLKGALFRLKTRMPRPNMSIKCGVHKPWTRIEPIDRWGHVGILDGTSVRLESPDGTIVAERPDARRYFSGGRRLFHWDALDLTYFLGYALWNYLTLPALLMRDDIEWNELEPGVLASEFPPHLPTHGTQQHHFDLETGLLTRYDYMPEVTFEKARAANIVLERGHCNGIPYEAKRTVHPLPAFGGKYLSQPVMVDMHFWDWELS
jgi:hypothetical protein